MAPAHLTDRNLKSLARKGFDVKFPDKPELNDDARKRRDKLVDHAHKARRRATEGELIVHMTASFTDVTFLSVVF